MNILFITPSVPSRFHRIRSLHLIKCLQKDHNVILLSLSSDRNSFVPKEIADECLYSEIIYKPKLRSYFDCLFALFSFTPFEVVYCKSPIVKKKVFELIKKYNIDLVYVKRLRSAQFVDGISIPVILDSTDAMSLFYEKMMKQGQWFKKPLYILEWLKYGFYEKKLSKSFKHWVTCSPLDCSYLEKKYPTVKCDCIPNGIDEYYLESIPSKVKRDSFMISGLMDKWVNVDAVNFFMKKIYPEVKTKIKSATLDIIGPNPVRSVKKYSSDSVTVMGEVPDIREEIARHEIIVCPVRIGTGTRNKILQAWAVGRPVVSTSEGAAGLMVFHNENIILADTPKDFQDALLMLHNDSAKMGSIISEGKKTVLKYYSADAIEKELGKVINKIVSTR